MSEVRLIPPAEEGGQYVMVRNDIYEEQQAEIERLKFENEQLHHEISYYESLANEDPKTDWPHRDGRYRDWLVEKLKAARAAGGT